MPDLRFFSLSSSSIYGNAFCIEGPRGTRIMVDCGVPLRRLEAGLREHNVEPETIEALFLTHAHGDHTRALNLKFPFPQRHRIPTYATHGVWGELQGKMGHVDPSLCRVLGNRQEVEVGELSVISFPKPHDCADPVGFIIAAGSTRLAVLTDAGRVGEDILALIFGCEFLILESNHDVEMQRSSGRPPWLVQRILGNRGHLSNEQAGMALARACTRETAVILLAHLSIDCNTPELAESSARKHLDGSAFRGVLATAPPQGPSRVYSGQMLPCRGVTVKTATKAGAMLQMGLASGNGDSGGGDDGDAGKDAQFTLPLTGRASPSNSPAASPPFERENYEATCARCGRTYRSSLWVNLYTGYPNEYVCPSCSSSTRERAPEAASDRRSDTPASENVKALAPESLKAPAPESVKATASESLKVERPRETGPREIGPRGIVETSRILRCLAAYLRWLRDRLASSG